MDITKFQIAIHAALGIDAEVYSVHLLTSGELSHTFRVNATSGVYFVKVKSIKGLPRFFEKEKKGLIALQQTGTLPVVKPYGIAELEDNAYLFMEYIEAAPPKADYWRVLGEKLAMLHHVGNRNFGFAEDNYIDQCLQINHRISSWAQFYIRNRLMPNVRQASEKHYLEISHVDQFDQLYKLLEYAFPEEPSALLHGNFWSGHLLTNSEGMPVAINPAVYYGHREMDIAKTMLVGRFPDEFYESYHAAYP